jgi:hypothetical protein
MRRLNHGTCSASRKIQLLGQAPSVFVEARQKVRPEGSAIEDHVVEDHADWLLHTAAIHDAAIEWAKRTGHAAHVARVRHLNDKKKPDHWRAV